MMRVSARNLGLGVLLLAVGCAKNAATAAPDAAAASDEMGAAEAPTEEAADDDGADTERMLAGPEDFESELGELETQLRAAGVSLEGVAAGGAVGGDAAGQPTPAGDTRAPGKAESKRKVGGSCQRVCDLAQAMCALESRICDMAGRHEDEPRYATACDRAAGHCQVASEACSGCAG